MKSVTTINPLRTIAGSILAMAMFSTMAQASTNYFNLDSNPSSLVTVYHTGDNTTNLALAGAWVSTNGSSLEQGVGDQSTNGYISITATTPTNLFIGTHGMRSAVVFGDLDSGLAPASFNFSCDLRIGAGNATPADGLSLNFVRNGDASITGTFPSTAYEKGANTGLAVCLLAFPSDNLATGIPGLQIKVDGIIVTNVAMTNLNGSCSDATSIQTGPSTTNLLADLCWQPFSVSLNASGLLSVAYKNTPLISGFSVGALAPGRFILAGRTGGSWQEQDADNILITTTTATNPVVGSVTGNYYGWSFAIYNNGTQTVDANSITVTVDGSAASPTGISQSGSATTVSLANGSAIFTAGSTHSLTVNFSGANFTGPLSVTRSFTVPTVIPSVGTFSSNPYGFKFNITDIATAGHILTPDTNTIVETLDGAPVTITRLVQAGTTTNVTVVVYDRPTAVLATGSQHTNVVYFTGADFPAVTVTNVFTVPVIVGSLDRVHHFLGTFLGAVLPKLTVNGGGRTGLPGDNGLDMGNPPSTNAQFFASQLDMLIDVQGATANDVMSVSLWVNRRTMNSSSDFWINSPDAANSGREFQLHGPYADNNFYFDTSGSTATPGGRLTVASSTFAPYQAVGNTTYWTGNHWHHIVAIKNGGSKQIWVDGQLFGNQDSGAFSLATYGDVNRVIVGAASPANLPVNGVLDDFAIYNTALSSNSISQLYNGTAPNAIDAGTNLLVWWDFNDAANLSLKAAANAVIVNFSQVLQSSTNVTGPFVDMPGVTSPYTNSLTSPKMFFRDRKY